MGKYKTELQEFIRDNFQGPGRTPQSCFLPDRKRIEFIDLVKGVCIILVVLLHSGYLIPVPGLKALRMPLYFVLSGLFFKDYGGIKNLVIKKTNKLIVPGLFFFSLFLTAIIITSSDPISAVICEIKRPLTEPFIANLPVWFLFCLFWVNLLYYAVHKAFGGGWAGAIPVLMIGLTGYILNCYNIYLPLFVGSALTATPFFFAGVMLKRYSLLQPEQDKTQIILCAILLCAAITYCIKLHTPSIEFVTNQYRGTVLEIYSVSIILVVSLIMICKTVRWLPVVSYLGRYSIIVLGCHFLYLNYIPIGMYVISRQPVPVLASNIISWILCWISIPLFRKLFPGFTAQKDIFRPSVAKVSP